MWMWFNCYLSGRHDYGMWCESGAMFLRCIHCGKRSAGWSVSQKPQAAQAPAALPATKSAPSVGVVHVAAAASRVLPFGRVAAR